MHKLKHPNMEDGVYLTVTQCAELLNVGRNTTLRLARESGAIRKIGRSCRIRKDTLLDFVENNFTMQS